MPGLELAWCTLVRVFSFSFIPFLDKNSKSRQWENGSQRERERLISVQIVGLWRYIILSVHVRLTLRGILLFSSLSFAAHIFIPFCFSVLCFAVKLAWLILHKASQRSLSPFLSFFFSLTFSCRFCVCLDCLESLQGSGCLGSSKRKSKIRR